MWENVATKTLSLSLSPERDCPLTADGKLHAHVAVLDVGHHDAGRVDEVDEGVVVDTDLGENRSSDPRDGADGGGTT